MNSNLFDDPFTPVCVTEYRKLNPIADSIVRRAEAPAMEYIEMLDDLSEHLAVDFICPAEDDNCKQYYEAGIEKAISERNPTKESLIKCARYMERLCNISISLNEFITR